MAVIPAEWLVLDVLATDFLLVEFHLCSPSSKDTPATHSPTVCNHSCGLLQVEDLTASHEAVLLEMENNHTVAIAILQDDHHHKVQGSYRTRRMRQFRVGRASQTFAAALPLLLLFLSSFLSVLLCLLCCFLWKEELKIQDSVLS